MPRHFAPRDLDVVDRAFLRMIRRELASASVFDLPWLSASCGPLKVRTNE
jgi:hypothetical protein